MHIHTQGLFISQTLWGGKRDKDEDTKTFRLKGKQYGDAQVGILSIDKRCIGVHHSTLVHPDSSGGL